MFFIRRTPHLLDKYLDKVELNKAIDDARPQDKFSYQFFDLQPSDKINFSLQRRRDRVRKKEEDPYFTKH